MHGLETLLYGIGLAGVAVNAASGVLEAGRKPLDLFGMVVIALAAALGGGSLRDLLLDRKVFWIADQSFLIAALVAGVLTFAAARRWRLPPNLFMLPDALGLALFTVSGTQIDRPARSLAPTVTTATTPTKAMSSRAAAAVASTSPAAAPAAH